MAVAALAATAASLVALPLAADDVSRTTADEPQYLLSAMSLWEDGDLDIADELGAERWRDFHADAALPRQTEPRPDGAELSPHEPLLPVLLAVPTGLAGWAGAKVALATMAGALAAALTWTAHRRFAVPVRVAAGVAAAVTVVPPIAVYGAQVYPELPAALLVTLIVAAAPCPTADSGDLRQLDRLNPVTSSERGAVHQRRTSIGWARLTIVALGLVALPWLAVKYLPVAAALTAVIGWWLWQQRRSGTLAGLAGLAAAAAASWVVLHQGIYGGWTSYAAGDHFVDGELTVAGSSPSWNGRSVRLGGLLLDAHFGLLVWAPVFVLCVAALAALGRRRPSGWLLLVAPLAAGWATATWVALTMSGWWWPGRQVVVVLPLAALALAWWCARFSPVRLWVTVATVVGLAGWWWTVLWSAGGTGQLIIDFMETSAPTVQALSAVLPDTQARSPGWMPVLLLWLGALGALAAWGWRSVAPATPTSEQQPMEEL
jgi:hypothetical protein